MKGRLLALAVLGQAACTESLPPWQLDHDRILAVRADPPAIAAEGLATIDLLVGMEGGGPTVVAPDSVAAADDPALVAIVSVGGTWSVQAPDETTLAAARAARSLPSDAPVPVQLAITVAVGGETLEALKTLNLGAESENPVLGEVTIDGRPAADELSLPVRDEILLVLDGIDPERDEVDWFTSVGTLEDATDADATLRVDDPADGWLAVVVRDGRAGVTWGFWSVRSDR